MALLIPLSIPNFLPQTYGEEPSTQQVVVADRDAGTLFLVNAATGERDVFLTFADFFPHDVMFDSEGRLWVLEPNPSQQSLRQQASHLSIIHIDRSPLIAGTVWQGPSDPILGAQSETIRMVFDVNGDIILSDNAGIIWRIDPDTTAGSVLTDKIDPVAVALANDGDVLALGSDGSDEGIFRVNPATGAYSLLSPLAIQGYPDIAVASDGTILVATTLGEIIKVDPDTGDQSLFFSDPTDFGYMGIEVNEDDDIFVTRFGPDHLEETVLKIDGITAELTQIAIGPPFDELFDLAVVPAGVVLKATVADASNAATGQSLFAGGRTFYGEKFGTEAKILGREVDCAMVQLRKHGAPTGFAQIGFYDSDRNLVKQFGTIDVSTLGTGYFPYEFCLPSSDDGHVILENQIFAVTYSGGDPINRIDVRRNYIGAEVDYDGLASYHVNFDTSWHTYNKEGNSRDLLFKLTNMP